MAHGGPSKRKPNNNIDDNNSEDELPPPGDDVDRLIFQFKIYLNMNFFLIFPFFSF